LWTTTGTSGNAIYIEHNANAGGRAAIDLYNNGAKGMWIRQSATTGDTAFRIDGDNTGTSNAKLMDVYDDSGSNCFAINADGSIYLSQAAIDSLKTALGI
jgi:hypothetical protein